MTEIILRRLDGSVRARVLVDADDYEWLSEHRWCLDSKGYARRYFTMSGERGSVAMHREILGLAPGDLLEADHINGDRLDNRRGNLRAVTHAENTQNVRQDVGRSGHRNVYWHEPSQMWRVQLCASGRLISGGYFQTIEEAAEAANRLRALHLPFAVEVAA